jgi:hypothetical protein
MNTYTWKIEQLDYDVSAEGQSNVVICVHWRLVGTNGTYSGQIYNTLALPFNPDKSFIEYADLTQKQIIDWVEANLGSENIAELKQNIDAQIEAQMHPKTGSGLPWAE